MAGRPKGARDKKKRITAAAKLALATSRNMNMDLSTDLSTISREKTLSPLEIMLKAAHHFFQLAHQDPLNVDQDALRQAATLSSQAAPYLHAKLASIEHSGTGKDGEVLVGVKVSFVDPKDTKPDDEPNNN